MIFYMIWTCHKCKEEWSFLGKQSCPSCGGEMFQILPTREETERN